MHRLGEPMHWTRVLGIALLVGGGLLLWMGFGATETFTEQAHEAITGRYSDTTTGYLVAGGVAVAAGLALVLFGARR
ncbi:membrane protein [Thioalkalivibrio sulfidiphilus HL-EbGr7]|uniref:Membrane protein n=2 Tax=Thioalkalivibrio TaxID=106633 RepID=B8GLL0_THISH|nr:membrane protein [Thioalkalivibrio sulfidiphilus HL-EbGr7]